MKTILIFAVLILIFEIFPAAARDQPGLNKALNVAVKMIDEGKCGLAWKEVWPFAKAGNPAALSFLAAVVLVRSVVPPAPLGQPFAKNSEEARLTHAVALALYGWKNQDTKVGIELDTILSGAANHRTSTALNKVLNCTRLNIIKSGCVDIAVQSQLIPSFNAYVNGTDSADREAVCLPTFSK